MTEVVAQSRFQSILFNRPTDGAEPSATAPAFFADLNLDQLFDSVVAGREEYNLLPFFSMPLDDPDSISYRHEVSKDLEGPKLRESVRKFAKSMRSMRQHLAQSEKLSGYQPASWFLDAVAVYCDAVMSIAEELSSLDLQSRGFRLLRDYVADYTGSEAFQSLLTDTRNLYSALSKVNYCVQIRDSRVTVSRYSGQPDYSAEIDATFQKFRQGTVKGYRTAFRDYVDMDSVEERIVNLLAMLYPDTFRELRDYSSRHRNYLNPVVKRFDREVQFYLAYLEFVEYVAEAGLKFCYPRVSGTKEVSARDTFDLALAGKLSKEHTTAVTNDFYLSGKERIFVVSGPNQGGKTTFARTFGQLHYITRLGCKVPGSEAQLFLCDHLFTHFEREEHLEDLRGKLQDELVRIHEILLQATGNSVVIMNESFASTTLKDAIFLGKEVLRQMIAKGLLGVYVTFIDELSTLDEATVSMVSTVVPDNPALRTYKVVRRPADGKAHAVAIAEKYGLTYEALRRRLSE